MNPMTLQGAALVLMLIGLPLTSWGTTGDQPWAFGLGLAAVALGGLVTPVLHFVGDDGDDREDESEDDGDDDGEDDPDRAPDDQEVDAR